VDGSGALRITVNSLQTDTAFKARPTGSVPPLQPSLLRIIH